MPAPKHLLFILAISLLPKAVPAQTHPDSLLGPIPRFRPGDIYGACDVYQPGGTGAIFRLNPVSGQSEALLPLLDFADYQNPSMLDFDASLDRLVAWAILPGISPSPVLVYVDAAGGFNYTALPGLTPAGLACTGKSRTYIASGSEIYYVDGMGAGASLGKLKDVAGTGYYSNPATLSGLKGWVYDPDSNCLVAAYETWHGTCSFQWVVGLHVLPLTDDGKQVRSSPPETWGVVWELASPCGVDLNCNGMSRLPNGTYMVALKNAITTEQLFSIVAINPATLHLSSLTTFASFDSCPSHILDAAAYSWEHDFVLGSDKFAGGSVIAPDLHLFTLGASGCGAPVPGPYLGGDVKLLALPPW